MTVQVFALAVVVGDAMSCIEFQAAGNKHVGLVRLSGADYTLSDFQSRSALQKFTLRVLVVMRAITQRGVACGEVADGLCELGARCSDACGIVLRAFMRCTRQSCISQFSA